MDLTKCLPFPFVPLSLFFFLFKATSRKISRFPTLRWLYQTSGHAFSLPLSFFSPLNYHVLYSQLPVSTLHSKSVIARAAFPLLRPRENFLFYLPLVFLPDSSPPPSPPRMLLPRRMHWIARFLFFFIFRLFPFYFYFTHVNAPLDTLHTEWTVSRYTGC